MPIASTKTMHLLKYTLAGNCDRVTRRIYGEVPLISADVQLVSIAHSDGYRCRPNMSPIARMVTGHCKGLVAYLVIGTIQHPAHAACMFDCLCMLDMHALSLATSNRMLTL
jgi:hypothetical protein